MEEEEEVVEEEDKEKRRTRLDCPRAMMVLMSGGVGYAFTELEMLREQKKTKYRRIKAGKKKRKDNKRQREREGRRRISRLISWSQLSLLSTHRGLSGG